MAVPPVLAEMCSLENEPITVKEFQEASLDKRSPYYSSSNDLKKYGRTDLPGYTHWIRIDEDTDVVGFADPSDSYSSVEQGCDHGNAGEPIKIRPCYWHANYREAIPVESSIEFDNPNVQDAFTSACFDRLSYEDKDEYHRMYIENTVANILEYPDKYSGKLEVDEGGDFQLTISDIETDEESFIYFQGGLLVDFKLDHLSHFPELEQDINEIIRKLEGFDQLTTR